MNRLFVAGAGTDIGKTYVTAALARRLRAAGRVVRAVKPIASGLPALDDPAFAASDTAMLLQAQGLPCDAGTVEACTPWRFAAPLSPDMAAAREGRALHLHQLLAFHAQASAAVAPGGLLIVEGVGGVMSPVTADATGLDWLERLDCPALLVAGSYLGAISHALTAAEAIRSRGVSLAAVIVNESPAAPAPLDETAAAIARFVHAPVLTLARGGDIDPAALPGLQDGA